jgi:hypothetical protein
MQRISGSSLSRRIRRTAVCASALVLLAGSPGVFAQVAPFSGQPGTVFSPPPPPPQAPPPRPAIGTNREPHQVIPAVAPGKIPLALSARYSDEGPFIQRGMHWRVFFSKPDPSGVPALAAEAKDSFPVFGLAPGEYVVHAAYGLATSTRRVKIGNEPRRRVRDLHAAPAF